MAKQIDASVAPHNFTSEEIAAIITEAKKWSRNQKLKSDI